MARPAGRSFEWNNIVKPRLGQIESWIRCGMTQAQCAAALGIAEATWHRFKKRHEELAEVVERARIPVIAELRSTLLDLALGRCTKEVTKTSVRKDEAGHDIKVVEKTQTREPPNVAAIHLLLKNMDRGNWSNDPVREQIARHAAGMETAEGEQARRAAAMPEVQEEKLAAFIEASTRAEQLLAEQEGGPAHD